ncbi:MAG: XRE family transcriptional regulator [Schwartzia succinivorans]|nr:XRE family transcriptional regulator [Schwartzia succinivorans]
MEHNDIFQSNEKNALALPSLSSHALKDILDEIMSTTDKTFVERLLFLMERTGKAPSEIYTKAGVTRQHFYKIRTNIDYKPTKETALAFAIALRLSLEETKDLIGRAGFMLSPSSKSDRIVEYFIKEGIYDVDEINDNLNIRGLGTLTNRRNGT